jgi:hypothetical protein
MRRPLNVNFLVPLMNSVELSTIRLLPFIQNYSYLIGGSVLALPSDSMVASLPSCFCVSWPRDIRFRGPHINFILLPYGCFKTKCPISQRDKARRRKRILIFIAFYSYILRLVKYVS